MFDIKHIKGNTSYMETFSNIGIYRPDDNRVVLIDTGAHKRMAAAVDKYLIENNLTVDTVICTHCHVDHICGNRYFYDKYKCKILSTEKEKHFIAQPDLESLFYYAGIDTDKTRNPFFTVEPAPVETLTEENLPDGLEIIHLPGHAFDMIGVRTSDGVLFLADSILSEKTWEEFKMPFFHDVNKSIETLRMIKETKADFYVPTHNDALTDITSLADYNIRKLEELKETVYSLCDGKSFDELFTSVMSELTLNIRTEKYSNYAIMLRNVLQSLVDDEKIKGVVEDNKYIYYRR